jgi:hypothetical protein
MATKAKSSVSKRLRYYLLSVGLTLASVVSFASITLIMPASQVYAAPTCAILDQGKVSCPTTITGSDCWYKDLGDPTAGPKKDGWVKAASCDNGVFKSILNPQVTPAEDPALTQCAGATSCDLVKKYVDPLINVLAAGVGVAVTISIVVGGIQYSSSAGDPNKASAAKRRIMNAIIALLGFFLFYAVLQWLIPGGLLNG